MASEAKSLGCPRDRRWGRSGGESRQHGRRQAAGNKATIFLQSPAWPAGRHINSRQKTIKHLNTIRGVPASTVPQEILPKITVLPSLLSLSPAKMLPLCRCLSLVYVWRFLHIKWNLVILFLCEKKEFWREWPASRSRLITFCHPKHFPISPMWNR